MKNPNDIYKKFSFTFAWGMNAEGEALRRIVLEGMERHGFKEIAPYIKYCIRETSQREEKESRAKKQKYTNEQPTQNIGR